VISLNSYTTVHCNHDIHLANLRFISNFSQIYKYMYLSPKCDKYAFFTQNNCGLASNYPINLQTDKTLFNRYLII